METPQPETAGENVVASDPIADAANAFKNYDTAAPRDDRPRDEHGRFVSTQPEAEEEIEPVASQEEVGESQEVEQEAEE